MFFFYLFVHNLSLEELFQVHNSERFFKGAYIFLPFKKVINTNLLFWMLLASFLAFIFKVAENSICNGNSSTIYRYSSQNQVYDLVGERPEDSAE